MSQAKDDTIFSPSEPQRWQLISQNLKAWYLSWPGSSTSTSFFFSDPDTLLTPERATIGTSNPGNERIDAILEYYRTQKPAKEILIWYLNSLPFDHLNARLLARGVGTGWRVEWMWFNLTSFAPPAPPLVEDVKIETTLLRNAETSSQHQYRLAAQISNPLPQAIGTVTLNLTPTSEPGGGEEHIAAGLFNMSVLPAFRNRGIGTALAFAACNLARELGCRYLYLNATALGKHVYQRAGFETMCEGIIWRLDRHRCRGFYTEAPSSNETVKFLEAVCLGDISALEELGAELSLEDLQQSTRNSMTPLELAVECKQTSSAEWLVQKGVLGDVLSFWDLGWKDRARELVIERPQDFHKKDGRSGRMPLDIALERDDQELADLLASVPPPRAESKKGELDLRNIDWRKHFDLEGDEVDEMSHTTASSLPA